MSERIMKRLFLALAAALLVVAPTSVKADIQDPPGGSQNISRKLGRSLGNIVYGAFELPDTVFRSYARHGRKGGGSYGLIDGTGRSAMRVGYGLFELVTFPFPAYKGGYNPPYRDGRVYPYSGYGEFAPQLGISSQARTYNRIGN